jgi:AcrR family transcriptional regulator
MDNNVAAGNNDVNVYIIRYAAAMLERPYHHGNLRFALLAQAERTLRERGVQDLSLRELAREIGVSHAAPRRHFPDRRALLDALAVAGFDRLGAELRAAMESAGASFPDRLQATAAAYIHFAVEDAELLDLMFTGKHRDSAQALVEAGDRAFAVLFELIAQGQDEGALEPGDPERVGLVLFATVQGLAALVTSSMVAADQLDWLLPEAIAHFLRGSRTAV